MPPEEKEEIKRVVKEAIRQAVHAELGAYKIPKEQHYLDHQWIEDLRQWQSTIRHSAIRYTVGLVVTAVGALLLYGFVFFKGMRQ